MLNGRSVLVATLLLIAVLPFHIFAHDSLCKSCQTCLCIIDQSHGSSTLFTSLRVVCRPNKNGTITDCLPPKESYFVTKLEIQSGRRGWKRISSPNLRARQVTIKDRQRLKTIPADSFKSFANSTEVLAITNTKIVKFPRKAINSLRSVLAIEITKNSELRLLPKKSFYKLQHLRSLNLGENSIRKIHRRTFQGLLNLTELLLESNKLSSIKKEVFHDVPKLRFLSFKGNRFKSLLQNQFQSLHKLELLNLNKNRLKELERQYFAGLEKLEMLNLLDNPIRKIDINPFFYMRKTLTFVYVDLTKLRNSTMPHIFNWFERLKSIELQLRRRQSLNNKMFAGIEVLEYLNIKLKARKNGINRTYDGKIPRDIFSSKINWANLTIKVVSRNSANNEDYHVNCSENLKWLVTCGVKVVPCERFLNKTRSERC